MHPFRLGLLVVCLLPALSFGQKREYVELQRDVAALQDQVRSLQSSQSENMGRLTAMLQQTIDSVSKVSTTVAVLDSQMRDRDKSLVAPVASVGTKVDELSNSYQSLKVSIDDLSSRLEKLQQSVIDLQKTMQVIQAPSAPPPAAGGMPGAAPSASAAPNGVSAESLYASAMRDKSGGSDDIAMQEFHDYLRYFGNTDTAPNAQYYIGEIYYNHKDYDNALKAFDMVLERYPDNNKTLDAMYMKGRTLVVMGERTKAAEQFRAVYTKSPRSELGQKAKSQLQSMGLSVTAGKPSPTRKRR